MTKMAGIDPSKYANSEVHQAVLTKDYTLLNALLSGLPRFSLNPSHVHTESDSNAEIEIGEARSSFIDFRNTETGKETPLHLAVRLADPTAVFLLMEAGADFNLQSDSGWNALEEAVHLGKDDVAKIILHHAKYHQWANLRRRAPLLVRKLDSVTDFYAEIAFRFESSVLPFVLKIAPSDTVRVWKRGKNIRIDTSLTSSVFGMFRNRRRRSERSLLFLGASSVWALYHRDKTAKKIFDGAHRDSPSEREVRKEVAEMMKKHLSRPGLDATNAKLKGKTETSVGPWKSTAYKIDNILLSVKHRRVLGATAEYGSDMWNEEELNEMLTAEEMEQWNAAFKTSDDSPPRVSVREESVEETESSYDNSSEKQSGKKKMFKNLKKNLNRIKKIAPLGSSPYVLSRKFSKRFASGGEDDHGTKDEDHETMYNINFKFKIWLSDEFPLQIQQFLPLLDILGHKSKLIRGLKEILTSLPHETFPVKASFPIMNVIKLIVSCTKFEELKPAVELPEISSNSMLPSVEPYGLFTLQSNRNIDDPFMIPLDYKKIA